ncbi:hypothetical protein RBH26_03210 [Natronolimnohabitans sp. A-GB9]|uniref:hypothetical protein n=1 Tax=Natronolimnohabitans sp. A-GB9 TaxID=3069757 RepID=UPI0027AF589C|nr:hypothetical protein [Natronolimnohabitans sp. A-GB9]MDQ2049484.1 hypothetical protein [Natronolimnohabitans sp. A-GB9]
MSDCLVYEASVLFAVITGTSATLLSLLLWSVFRRTPIGTLVFGLLLVMSLFTVQNGLVLLVGCDVPFVRLLKSGINTSVLVLVALLFLTLHDFGGGT